MSSFLENKQNLFILGEIIIIAGVAFYFHKRLKHVTHNINELHKMILAQQEQINKQAGIIDRLSFQLNSLTIPSYPQFTYPDPSKIMNENIRASQVEKPATPPPKKRKEKIVDIPSVKLEEKKDFEKTFNPTLIFKTFSTINEPKEGPSIEIIEEKKVEEEITEEDLDAELEAELNELNE